MKRSPHTLTDPKPINPKPPTLGDNLNVRFRAGTTAVFFSAWQSRATRDVLHLMQAVARVQPLDESLTTAAADAIAALTIVLAKTTKGDPDQPLLPGIEPDDGSEVNP